MSLNENVHQYFGHCMQCNENACLACIKQCHQGHLLDDALVYKSGFCACNCEAQLEKKEDQSIRKKAKQFDEISEKREIFFKVKQEFLQARDAAKNLSDAQNVMKKKSAELEENKSTLRDMIADLKQDSFPTSESIEVCLQVRKEIEAVEASIGTIRKACEDFSKRANSFEDCRQRFEKAKHNLAVLLGLGGLLEATPPRSGGGGGSGVEKASPPSVLPPPPPPLRGGGGGGEKVSPKATPPPPPPPRSGGGGGGGSDATKGKKINFTLKIPEKKQP